MVLEGSRGTESEPRGVRGLSAIIKFLGCHMGVSENVVSTPKPNGFADHYPYEKWLAIIGKINPTFSVTNPNGAKILMLFLSPSPCLQNRKPATLLVKTLEQGPRASCAQGKSGQVAPAWGVRIFSHHLPQSTCLSQQLRRDALPNIARLRMRFLNAWDKFGISLKNPPTPADARGSA